MSQKNIRKAVIAAAGFGTRFLPQTKAMPKEMLPLVDKPIIQRVVEELVASGITDIVIITGYHKRTIEDHFDKASGDLIANLRAGGKEDAIKNTKAIAELANFAYIRQKAPISNASPILDAAHYIGNEPFIYTYADDFIEASPTRFEQLMTVYKNYGGSILSCIEDDSDEGYSRYGYVGGDSINEALLDVKKIVEKPLTRDKAPSALASVSGYILEPMVIKYIQALFDKHQPGESEVKFQDALQQMINDHHHVYGLKIQGTYYDTGNPLNYLKTVFDFALKRPDIAPELTKYLKNKLNN
jgi:UTP--glucose-1-phosphate uridylyltransferase